MLNPHPQHGHLGMGCARAPRAGPGTCHSGPETCHSGPGTCHSGPGTCHRAPARLGARVGMKLCLGKLFISAFRTMGAMARSNRFRAGGAAEMWGARRRLAGPCSARHAAEFADTSLWVRLPLPRWGWGLQPSQNPQRPWAGCHPSVGQIQRPAAHHGYHTHPSAPALSSPRLPTATGIKSTHMAG